MARLLIVYYHHQPRRSITDHLYSFRRYGGHDCWYLNAAVWGTPRIAADLSVDLVVFHTTFLSQRWDPLHFRHMTRKAAVFARSRPVKAAIPQDEFMHTDSLRDFINAAGVTRIFSAARPSEWPKIYSGVDLARIRLTQVLTGYLDDATVRRIENLALRIADRPIDIGYRAWKAAPWLGRHGYLKLEIAEIFRKKAAERGLVADISTELKDTLMGDDWHRFLLRCKYAIGVEGGASILDRDGTIKARTEEYTSKHPGAGFEEIEGACFPGLDGSLNLFALSPRHLEACATRTCQILVEGEYNGILKPGRHYIELKRNMENLDAVMDMISEGRNRREIAQAAHDEIVAGRRYSYAAFVETVVSASVPAETGPAGRAPRSPVLYLVGAADALAIVLSAAWRTATAGGPGAWIKRVILKPLLLRTGPSDKLLKG